jgi:16S rRNA (guanine966-N2)-methyltransferase
VRESLFSSLDSALLAEDRAWSDVEVLDLYAGSGALGLEALSRGAQAVVLVEKSAPAAQVLQANIAAVGLPGASVLVRDVTRLADQPAPGAATLVFADPPYEVAAVAIAAVLARLLTAGWIAEGADVVVERPARDTTSPLPESWPASRRREYGDTVLWYGRAAADGEEAP